MNPFESLQRQIEMLSRRVEDAHRVEFTKFVPLAAPLTSTSWDGDAYSTTAKTKIDLSAVFAVPAGVKAVLVAVVLKDSGSATTESYLILSPSDTATKGTYTYAMPVDSRFNGGCHIVPCDANGDIYYQIVASGAGTMNIYMEINGYWR